MKDINLPTTQSVSLTLGPQEMRNLSEHLNSRRSSFDLGELLNASITAEMDQAKLNGGKVLYSASSIESKIEGLLLKYFMGGEQLPSERREIFQQHILNSSDFSFSQKRNLEGKSKNRFQSLLKKIGQYRNAFAHGQVKHDTKRKCFLEYYSGGPESRNLSDQFWEELEADFTECDILAQQAVLKLETLYG